MYAKVAEADGSQRNAMDSVLADINVEDPTTGADSDVEMAGITPRAVQKQEKKSKDKKEKRKSKDGVSEDKKKRRHSEVEGAVEGKRKKKSKKD